MSIELKREVIIRSLSESLYMDYDVEGARENLKEIRGEQELMDILNAISTVEMFFNGDLNE